MGYRMNDAMMKIPGVYIFVIGDHKANRSATEFLEKNCIMNRLRMRVIQRDDATWPAQVFSATPYFHVVTILGVIDHIEMMDFWSSLEPEDIVHVLVLDDTIPLADMWGSQVEVWRRNDHRGVPYCEVVKSIAKKLRG